MMLRPGTVFLGKRNFHKSAVFFYCRASGKALSGAQAGAERGLIQKGGNIDH